MITEGVSQLWRGGGDCLSGPSRDAGWQRRLETLEARIEHLETAFEGLQDAIHRRAVLDDESIGVLRRRTEPDQIARDLNHDARSRGL